MVHPPFAAKLALHAAMKRQGITTPDLAERLGLRDSDIKEMLDPYVNNPISQLVRALQVAGRRLVVDDLAADGGEHIFYPANSLGNLGMSRREFIRRIRRYALAHALTWRIEDTAFYEGASCDEENQSLLRVGSYVLTLPEEDVLAADVVSAMLKTLNIDSREF